MAEKSSYDHNAEMIEKALRLGIDAESEDPAISALVPSLTSEQIRWISGWLASENIGPIPKRSQKS